MILKNSNKKETIGNKKEIAIKDLNFAISFSIFYLGISTLDVSVPYGEPPPRKFK